MKKFIAEKKYRFALNLQMFAEDGGAASGVEGTFAAGEQSQGAESASTQTGDQGAAAEQGKGDVAFAKRLSAAQEKWNVEKEAEIQKIREEYKDHDTYRKATDYLQRTSGISDLLTLKEEIELADLQERADKEKVPPAVLKRIDELEAKAAKADEFEAKNSQEKAAAEFEQSLKTFVEGREIDGKPVDHAELWKYMHENEIGKPEAALKAMKADILEAKLATAKEDTIKEYLNSKKGVKTEGASGAAAQSTPNTGGGFKGAEARAIARIKASRTAE